jgi:hypothetical protein
VIEEESLCEAERFAYRRPFSGMARDPAALELIHYGAYARHRYIL